MARDRVRVELLPILFMSFLLAGACAHAKTPATSPVSAERQPTEKGRASWYGTAQHGRRTASGEPYDMHAMTAAHRTLPFGTIVRVTELKSGRSVNVRINDRGPFRRGRIVDLSYEAAKKLGIAGRGTAQVKVVVIKRG